MDNLFNLLVLWLIPILHMWCISHIIDHIILYLIRIICHVVKYHRPAGRCHINCMFYAYFDINSIVESFIHGIYYVCVFVY